MEGTQVGEEKILNGLHLDIAWFVENLKNDIKTPETNKQL